MIPVTISAMITLVRIPFYSLLNPHYYLRIYPLNLCYLSGVLRNKRYKTALVDGEVFDFKGVRPAEGERTILELINALNSSQVELLNGLCYKENGQIKRTKPRELIKNLDETPLPDREFFDRKNYNNDVMISSRGCPFDYIFCASKVMWGQVVRYRSLESVRNEIHLLKKLYAAKFIRFLDDTFTLDKKRVLEFCDRVKENRLDDIEYSIGSRIDTLDEKMIKALKEIDVRTITFGVESGSPRNRFSHLLYGRSPFRNGRGC